jgi:peptidoglycan/LPS O-acetylase OafA/YrhL
VGKRIGRSKAASLTFLEHRLGRLRIPDLDRGRLIEFLWERRPGPAILKAIKLSWPFIAILFVTVLIKVDLVTKWEGVSSYPLIGAATGCMIVIVTTEEMTFLGRLFTLAPLVALGRTSYGFYLWHYLIIH